MTNLRSWIQQPTTVAGISAMLGTLVAALMHQVTWMQAIPLLAGAAVSAILPGNRSAKQQAELLTGTMVAKFTSGTTTAASAAKPTDAAARPSN